MLLGGVAFIAALWIAWPYYAAYRLFVALRDGDSSVLEERVAWDSVRQGLRGDLNALFLEMFSADAKKNNASGGLATGLAFMLAPAMINQIVDGYVTPQAIARAAKRPETSNVSAKESDEARPYFSEAAQKVRRLRLDQVQYAFFSGGPLTFKVDILPEGNPPLQNPVTLLFKWDGNWKLVRIRLPADVSDHLSALMKSQPDAGSLRKDSILPENRSSPETSKPQELTPQNQVGAPLISSALNGKSNSPEKLKPQETGPVEPLGSGRVVDVPSLKRLHRSPETTATISVPPVGALSDTEEAAIAQACSDQATAKGLHGIERREFRAECKKRAGRY